MTPIEYTWFDIPADLTQKLTDVQQFAEIDSTNVEAMRQLQSGKTGCFLLLAHAQSAGRGRRGRVWRSPAGAGVYMTLVRPFALGTTGLQALSLITALSVHEALKSYGIVGIQLKWPNDLLVEKHKLAGILLELKQTNNASYVLFGIGINLLLPVDVRDSIDQPVTDLGTLLRCTPDKSMVVTRVIECLLKNLEEFENSAFSTFQARWNALDCYFGQDIVLQLGEQRKIGNAQGVDETGALLLKTAMELEKISGGEISSSILPANHQVSGDLDQR